MRDLTKDEMGHVYGAGGSSCNTNCGGNGGSKNKGSKKHGGTAKHGSKKNKSGSKGRCY